MPAHLLVLIALGLWLGQQVPPRIEAALLTFSLLLVVGLALSPFSAPGGGQTSLLLACALGVGLMVAVAWPLPSYVTAGVAGLVALLVGLDSAPEVAGTRAKVIILVIFPPLPVRGDELTGELSPGRRPAACRS